MLLYRLFQLRLQMSNSQYSAVVPQRRAAGDSRVHQTVVEWLATS